MARKPKTDVEAFFMSELRKHGKPKIKLMQKHGVMYAGGWRWRLCDGLGQTILYCLTLESAVSAAYHGIHGARG